MSIVKADFDWISLLVVVVAGIIGLIKSNTKKTTPKPVADMPRGFMSENPDEETVEWFNNTDYAESISLQQEFEETKMQGDYYKQPETLPEENPDFACTSGDIEMEIEELKHFNLRQAIISSEILRRPEY